jgi:uncharacterized protein YjbI with pentapeptide repeats
MRSHKTRAVGLLGGAVALLLGACQMGSDPVVVPDESYQAPVAAMHSQLSAVAPAALKTTVVIAGSSISSGVQSVIPVRLSAAEVLRACIPEDEPDVVGVSLASSDGRVYWSHQRGTICPTFVEAPAGDYSLRITHGSDPAQGGGRTAFVYKPAATEPALLSTAVAGWYQYAYATLRSAKSGHLLKWDTNGNAAIDYASNSDAEVISLASLLQYAADVWTQPSDLRPPLYPLSGNRVSYCRQKFFPFPHATQFICTGVSHPNGADLAPELGEYLADSPNSPSLDPAYDADAGAFIVNPRYFSNADLYQPKEGEVVLYWPLRSDFPRGGFVFNADTRSPLPEFQPTEIRLGPNTVFSSKKSDFFWQFITVSGKLSWPPFSNGMKSIVIRTAHDIVVSTNRCPGCDLSGLNLSGENLFFADLTGAKLRNVIADGTNFGNARLRGADFSGASLRGANFSSSYTRTVLEGASFANANLRGASFANTHLGCVDLRNADLGGADFGNSGFQCVDMSGAKLRGARFDAVPKIPIPVTGFSLIGAPIASACLQDQSWIKPSFDPISGAPATTPDANGLFAGLACSGANLARAQISTAAPPPRAWKYMDLSEADMAEISPGDDFSNIDFSRGHYRSLRLDYAKLRCSKFDTADLINASFAHADLSCNGTDLGFNNNGHSTFLNANLRGANLAYVNANNADFSKALLSGDPAADPSKPESSAANMSYLWAENVTFGDTDLTRVNFSNAQIMLKPTFSGTLVGANFAGAVLPAADFSKAKLQGVNFTNANLTGAKFANAMMGLLVSMKTNFAGAFLQGADFTGVEANDTDFTNATMATTDGNWWNFQQWSWDPNPALSQSDCSPFGYSATQWPSRTFQSTICPDGSRGPCTDKAWTAKPVVNKCPAGL